MKVYIRTYGCQMNERDSESLASMLVDRGYELSDSEDEADVLLFNTCSVRDQAERKVLGKLGILSRLKRRNPNIFIGVLGCMAQSRGAEIKEKIPHVDFVVGTRELSLLPEILESEMRERRGRVAVDMDVPAAEALTGHLSRPGSVSAYIAVMRGCNRFCSYCIVPYVRGPERSRKPEDILDEAGKLVESGVKEIVLLGQNVAAYGLEGAPSPDHSPFADLLHGISGIEGLARIRFTSPHPAYFNGRLIRAVKSLKKVCSSVHLPLQSGSDRILKLMNRNYTAAEYILICERLRDGVPDMTFSTDIIVGFPGETERDFNETREVMRKVGFDNAYIFKYSPRKNTPAASMPGKVPAEVKSERNTLLLDDLKAAVLERNREYVGRDVEVLVEGPSKRNPDRWQGRTASNKVVVFDSTVDMSPGDIINARITRTTHATLFSAGKTGLSPNLPTCPVVNR